MPLNPLHRNVVGVVTDTVFAPLINITSGSAIPFVKGLVRETVWDSISHLTFAPVYRPIQDSYRKSINSKLK